MLQNVFERIFFLSTSWSGPLLRTFRSISDELGVFGKINYLVQSFERSFRIFFWRFWYGCHVLSTHVVWRLQDWLLMLSITIDAPLVVPAVNGWRSWFRITFTGSLYLHLRMEHLAAPSGDILLSDLSDILKIKLKCLHLIRDSVLTRTEAMVLHKFGLRVLISLRNLPFY